VVSKVRCPYRKCPIGEHKINTDILSYHKTLAKKNITPAQLPKMYKAEPSQPRLELVVSQHYPEIGDNQDYDTVCDLVEEESYYLSDELYFGELSFYADIAANNAIDCFYYRTENLEDEIFSYQEEKNNFLNASDFVVFIDKEDLDDIDVVKAYTENRHIRNIVDPHGENIDFFTNSEEILDDEIIRERKDRIQETILEYINTSIPKIASDHLKKKDLSIVN